MESSRGIRMGLLLNTNEKWYFIVRKRRIATPWIVYLVAWFQIFIGGQLSTEFASGPLGWHEGVAGTACWAASPAVEDPGFLGDGFIGDGESGGASDGIPVSQALVCDGIGVSQECEALSFRSMDELP
ncbi:MAG: hypothetical protein ACK52S_05720 [Pirellula sp.]